MSSNIHHRRQRTPPTPDLDNASPGEKLVILPTKAPKRPPFTSNTTTSMAGGKSHSKRVYKRPNPKQLGVTQPTVLIPQNSLLGLPDELQVEVVRHAVKQQAPIRASQLSSTFAELLMPLAVDDHILAIAETELYEQNSFVEKNMAVKNVPALVRRGKHGGNRLPARAFLPSVMKAADRHLVKHLHLRKDLEIHGGDVNLAMDPTPSSLSGTAYLLSFLPDLYPNLKTLQVDFTIDLHSFANVSYMLLHTGQQSQHHKWRGWELDGYLRHTIAALVNYNSAGLQSKTLTLTQAPAVRRMDGSNSTRIVVTPESSIRDVVLQMTDLGVSHLPITDACNHLTNPAADPLYRNW